MPTATRGSFPRPPLTAGAKPTFHSGLNTGVGCRIEVYEKVFRRSVRKDVRNDRRDMMRRIEVYEKVFCWRSKQSDLLGEIVLHVGLAHEFALEDAALRRQVDERLGLEACKVRRDRPDVAAPTATTPMFLEAVPGDRMCPMMHRSLISFGSSIFSSSIQ